jgi:hypothetical protein
MKTLILTLAIGSLTTALWAQEAPVQPVNPIVPEPILQPISIEVINAEPQTVLIARHELIICPIRVVEPEPHLDAPLMDLLPHVPDSWQTIHGRIFYPTSR